MLTVAVCIIVVRSKQQSGSSGKRGLSWNSKELGSDPGSAQSFTLPCHFLGGKSAPDLRSPSPWACSRWEVVPCTPSTFYQSLPAPGPACSKDKHCNVSTGPIRWCWPDAGPPIRNRKSGRNRDTGPGSRRRLPLGLERAACNGSRGLRGVASGSGPMSGHPGCPGWAGAGLGVRGVDAVTRICTQRCFADSQGLKI